MTQKNSLPIQSFSSREISFLAEKEPILILPRYTMNGTSLIGAKLPNLRALNRVSVPLWLALLLKKQGKCNIVVPDWLTVAFLKSKHEEEIAKPNNFSKLYWHWIPISKLLFDVCPDDFFDSPHELRSLIQDLREIRLLKARKGMQYINEINLELTGLSLTEINEMRPFIINSMNQLKKLKDSVTIENEEAEIDEQDERGLEAERKNMYNETEEYNYENDAPNKADTSHLISGLTDADTTIPSEGDTTLYNREEPKRHKTISKRRGQDIDDDSDDDIEYRH